MQRWVKTKPRDDHPSEWVRVEHLVHQDGWTADEIWDYCTRYGWRETYTGDEPPK